MPSVIRDQLLKECQAMARYAFASGHQVPPSVVRTLESFARPRPPTETCQAEDATGADARPGIKHVDSPGAPRDLRPLVVAHRHLSSIVAPATPRTILFLDQEGASKSCLRFLGPVPIVQQMMVVAIICLTVFIGLSLSGSVSLELQTMSIFECQGLPLLINEAFYLAAAGLGAAFAALFEMNRYIVRGTFDPRHSSTYWIRLALGLIAGMVLAELIPLIDGVGTLHSMAKPVLAMLGGFSASVVNRILRRLLDTVESLVRGEAADVIESQQQAMRAHLTQQLVQHRLELATGLMRLQQQLGADASQDQLRQYVHQMLDRLVPFDLDAELSPSATGD